MLGGISSAQVLSIQAGVPPLGRYRTESQSRNSFQDRSFPLSLAAAIDLDLTRKIGLELSGLYRRVGIDTGGGYSFFYSTSRERGYAWEFPLVAKYRLKRHVFTLGGPSTEWLHTHTDAAGPTTVL